LKITTDRAVVHAFGSFSMGVSRLAERNGLQSRCVAVTQVKKVFGAFHAKTKHEIALAVSQQLPDLAPQLPRYRKAWMSEGSQMAVFDAAALALTYFYSGAMRGRGLPVTPSKEPGASNSTDPI
jgi:hypothetical protein